MNGKIGTLFALATLLFGLSGCLSSLKSVPPAFYEVDYPYQGAECSRTIPGEVKIWPLSAASPYDREQMVLFDASRQVHLADQYRWVAAPGNMISDKLLRDFTLNQTFAQAFPASRAMEAPLELSGEVYRFGWEQGNGSSRAVLEVEVSLLSNTPKRTVLFRKHYQMQSDPVSEGSAERFAEAMSGLVGRLSLQLRQDLCAASIP